MIKKIQAGDTEAFDILVRKYYSVIYQFCYRRLNGDTDTAADITQDVFLKLLENIHTVRMLGKFQNYLLTIAANTCNNYFKKAKPTYTDLNALDIIDDTNDILEKVIENENFASWAIISIFALLFIVDTIFIITRIILYKSRVIDENTTMAELDTMAKAYVNRPYEIAQTVFEIIISNTCIIVMMYVYYCIEKYMLFLQNYLGIIMIALIVLAILLNNFLDYILKQDIL